VTTPAVRILGAHRLQVSEELISSAVEAKFPNAMIKWWKRGAIRREVKAELSLVALIEVEILGADGRLQIGDFRQSDSDQVAYDEAYLSPDGEQVVSRDINETPGGPNVRVGFFLHHFDWTQPLMTSYGPVKVPRPSPMPERLARLMPYEPVD
jgi:hypothetical protein